MLNDGGLDSVVNVLMVSGGKSKTGGLTAERRKHNQVEKANQSESSF